MNRRISLHRDRQGQLQVFPSQPRATKKSKRPMMKCQPSYRASFVLENKDAFAPLRFTMGSSGWSNDCVRTVLVSPPTIENEEQARGSDTCPRMPAMEEVASDQSFKRSGFFQTKQSSPSSLEAHVSPIARSSLNLSEMHDLNIINEAASALLIMRFPIPSTAQQQANNYKHTFASQTNGMTRIKQETVSELAPLPFESLSPSSMSSGETESKADSANNRLKPLRLGVPADSDKLNSLHCFVRSELLELFVADNDKSLDAVARVGIRCVHCARAPLTDAPNMASFFPKSLQDIYRSVCTWQRVHFQACEHIPHEIRETYLRLKAHDKTRGKTSYWVTSALQLGVSDMGTKREGICFSKKSRRKYKIIRKSHFQV